MTDFHYPKDINLKVEGVVKDLYSHRDRNRLTKIAEPTPNPTALAAMQE